MRTAILVTAIAAAAVVAAASAGCGRAGASATTSSSRPPASAPDPAVCSQKAPAVIPAERWAPARQTLAPPGARTIRLCRYSGLNAHPRLTLVASALVESPALVRALVSELDRLGALRGPVACPLDDGSQIMALLSYPGARRVTISVGLSGCELVTNGSVHRTAAGIGSSPGLGPRLVAKLERLLDGRPPAPAARHAGDAPAG